MSIEVTTDSGWLISHEKFVATILTNVDNSGANFVLKPELFRIITPFKQTKKPVKLRGSQEGCQDFEKEVQNVQDLFSKFRIEIRTVIDESKGDEPGNKDALETSSRVYTESGKYSMSDLRGGNNCTCPTAKILNKTTYIFPANCRFYCYDVVDIPKHIHHQFDLILLDPPWRNRYIRRKRKKADHAYAMMFNNDLKDLPLENYLRENGLVVVWCTNSAHHMNSLLGDIFDKWGVRFVAKWYWVKVTTSLETVCPFSKPPRKQPFEQIIFGCKKERAEALSIPTNKLVVSVPSAVHSHKPPLVDLLKPYLPQEPDCLEIFARYLLPNWTSYGKEVLRLQHESLYNVTS